MAGSIVISGGVSWSCGSVVFDSLVERTWEELALEERELVEEAYRPLREGFDIIALDQLDERGLQVFVRGSRKGLEKFEVGNPLGGEHEELYRGMIMLWREFLELVERDGRSE